VTETDAQRDTRQRLQTIAAARRAVTNARHILTAARKAVTDAQHALQIAIDTNTTAAADEPAAIRAAFDAGLKQTTIAIDLGRSREHIRLVLKNAK